jgi:hypothetical protein
MVLCRGSRAACAIYDIPGFDCSCQIWAVVFVCIQGAKDVGSLGNPPETVCWLDCGVSLGLLARVHQACIPPVANYGCELWGLRNMATRQARQREKLLMAHVNMLRGIIGARKSTPHALVFLESSSAPCQIPGSSSRLHFGTI